MSVELGPQIKQGLQSDFHEKVVTDVIAQSPQQLDHYESQAQCKNNQLCILNPPRTRIWPANMCSQLESGDHPVDDDFERPRFEQV